MPMCQSPGKSITLLKASRKISAWRLNSLKDKLRLPSLLTNAELFLVVFLFPKQYNRPSLAKQWIDQVLSWFYTSTPNFNNISNITEAAPSEESSRAPTSPMLYDSVTSSRNGFQSATEFLWKPITDWKKCWAAFVLVYLPKATMLVLSCWWAWCKLPRKVSYKHTFGVPDQGQTLDVWESQTTESALRWQMCYIPPRHNLELNLGVILEHVLGIKTMTWIFNPGSHNYSFSLPKN